MPNIKIKFSEVVLAVLTKKDGAKIVIPGKDDKNSRVDNGKIQT